MPFWLFAIIYLVIIGIFAFEKGWSEEMNKGY